MLIYPSITELASATRYILRQLTEQVNGGSGAARRSDGNGGCRNLSRQAAADARRLALGSQAAARRGAMSGMDHPGASNDAAIDDRARFPVDGRSARNERHSSGAAGRRCRQAAEPG